MFVKLTDIELVMMSAAARRDDRDLEPPKSMKASTAARVAAKLIASGLVREIKAKMRIPTKPAMHSERKPATVPI
jgi:hypothetical protein